MILSHDSDKRMRSSKAAILGVLTLLLASIVRAGESGAVPRTDNVLRVVARGEVAVPGSVFLQPGARISELLRQSGGFKERAFLPGAALVRESERIRRRIELASWRVRIEAIGHPLAEWLGRQDATGRVPVRVDHPRLLKNSPYDLPLEDGDLLDVPATPSSVRVDGAVVRRSDIPFAPGRGADFYIRRAGGASTDGDPTRALLRKSGGAVSPLRRDLLSWSEERHRWEIAPWGDPPAAIEAGDLLYIPVVSACGPKLLEGISWTDVLQTLLGIVAEPPPPVCARPAEKRGSPAP